MYDTREHDQYPLTWELPAGVTLVVALAGVELVHLGRAIANLTVGAPWAWPAPERLFTSLPRVLSGDAAAGLASAPHAASAWLLYTWIAITLAVGIVLGALAARWITNRWGVGAVRGTATISQARQVLGVRRLRRNRHVIRPDLAGPSRGRP